MTVLDILRLNIFLYVFTVWKLKRGGCFEPFLWNNIRWDLTELKILNKNNYYMEMNIYRKSLLY